MDPIIHYLPKRINTLFLTAVFGKNPGEDIEFRSFFV